jgi:hypothetical protein
MRKSLIFIALTIFAATLFIDNLSAQNRQMLLFEIDGNRYQRCNYNKEGELQSFEKLIIGSIVEKAKSYRLPVEIYSYNAEGQLKDSTRTIYTCRPEEQSVLLNVFPFTDYGKGSEIKVNVEDEKAFYPVDPETGWEMKPIEFSLKIDKGLVGFLGGNSKIIIYDRQVVPNDTLQTGQYEINSKVDLGVYVLGIKVKGLAYRVIEIIDKDRGIIHQKFTSDDDSYFVIRLL